MRPSARITRDDCDVLKPFRKVPLNDAKIARTKIRCNFWIANETNVCNNGGQHGTMVSILDAPYYNLALKFHVASLTITCHSLAKFVGGSFILEAS